MGPSIVEKVRERGWSAVVINTTFRLMPEAHILFAADRMWWHHYPDAMSFAGRKVCSERLDGVEYKKPRNVPIGGNSALRAAHLLEDEGVNEIIIFGVDLVDSNATHWHGQHHFRNISPGSFKKARTAWSQYAKTAKPKIYNANEASALQCFPFIKI